MGKNHKPRQEAKTDAPAAGNRTGGNERPAIVAGVGASDTNRNKTKHTRK